MQCIRCGISGIKSVSALKEHHRTDDCQSQNIWFKIFEAKKNKNLREAEKLTRKALGIHRPMSDESKKRLQEYNKKNREEIIRKRKQKRMFKSRFKVHQTKPKSDTPVIESGVKPVTRKR